MARTADELRDFLNDDEYYVSPDVPIYVCVGGNRIPAPSVGFESAFIDGKLVVIVVAEDANAGQESLT